MIKPARTTVALAVSCAAAACSGSNGPSSVSVSVASFQTAPCPQPNVAGVPDLDIPPGVQCGYLTVPENRSKPKGRQIRIFVMRAPAVSATPEPDPIVYLSGEPGAAGSLEVATMIKQGINAEREVIFVDQRGTHHADPFLACPEWEQFLFDAFSLPFSADSSRAMDSAAIQTCHDRLAAMGFDLAAYNTRENAADIADLRVALGIDSWNVYGVSYGTRLALTLLRDHPQGIRSMVLDSVSPPVNNIVEKWWQAPASSLEAIFAACTAQPDCNAFDEDLDEDFTQSVNNLDATPAVVQLPDASGTLVNVNVDGFAFAYTLIFTSEHADASTIPQFIADTAYNQPQTVAAGYLALRGAPELIGLGGFGLGIASLCEESANLTTEAATLATSKAALPEVPNRVLGIQPKQGRLFTECPIWNVGKAPPSAIAPTVSDLPVLIMEGAFDAATAPEWVDLITPDLKSSQVVPFPFTGHAVLPKSQCAVSIMSAFLDAPTKPVDQTCAAQTTRPFVFH